MTLIENDSPKVHYTGPFIKGQLLPLTFPYIATEDVKMSIDDKPAIFNVDYEIIIEPNDEHPVAYPNSAYIKNDLPNAKQITLYRVTPLDQQAPFPQQSKFRSERVEQALDKLTMQQQEQEEQLSRCIIAPITLETFNGQLPAPAADQALKWNTEGTELENYDIIGEQEAFETEVNTKFEEQSTAIENRIGQFEEETNVQFSEFRNEINENLEAVLNAAEKLEELDAAVQTTENAAEKANQSALSAQSSAQSAQDTYKQFQDSVDGALNTVNDTAQGAITTIDTKSSETIESINNIKTDTITNIEFIVDGEKKEIQDLADEIKDSAEDIINRLGSSMFDTILKDHVLTYEESKGLALQGTYVYKDAIAGSRYGYPDFYNKCLEEKESATPIEAVLGENTITIYVHSNGHQYYDIADLEVINAWFETYGSAWFYGVDTENERIFLPRNNYFDQATGDILDVGQSVEAGLPNIEGTITANVTYSSTLPTGALYANSYSSWRKSGSDQTLYHGATYLDASRSSAVYGKSDTVQPNAVKKLLYICVGNTETVSTITDVVEVTTTENDTLPLGYHFYQANAQPSVSYLKSSGQWNDGNIYTTFYNEFVQKIGQAFAGGYVVEYTTDYTDYDLVINQDDMTFRLPLLDGSEDIPSDKTTDLTLDATGSTYTAPANGWYYVVKKTAGTNQYIALSVGTYSFQDSKNASGADLTVLLPVKKGDVVTVTYNATGATTHFRFIEAQGNGSLYFKVANAVQNLELLNAGEVLEAVNNVVSNNSKVWDGQWVNKSLELTTATAVGTYTIDLSSYLPEDSYNYEVMVTGRAYSSGNSGSRTSFKSDLINSDMHFTYTNTNSRHDANTIIVPISTTRKIYYEILSAAVAHHIAPTAIAYRRIGTNL